MADKYVRDMNGAELRAHMERLKAMPGWSDPLSDSLYAEIQSLDSVIKRQAASARMGMDSAQAAGAEYYRLGKQALDEAGRLAARTSFEELDSQRQANAMLTAEIATLEAERDALLAQLGDIRGLFKMPDVNDPLEPYWIDAMSDPLSVKAYVEACIAARATPQPIAVLALTGEDIERQYENGICLGSGLPRATCPCGFCQKYREPRILAAQPSPEPERADNCGHCHTCAPITMENMRMILCKKCGNKRCPQANDHRNACTGSNEPGQPGSAYPAAPHTESHALGGGDVAGNEDA